MSCFESPTFLFYVLFYKSPTLFYVLFAKSLQGLMQLGSRATSFPIKSYKKLCRISRRLSVHLYFVPRLIFSFTKNIFVGFWVIYIFKHARREMGSYDTFRIPTQPPIYIASNSASNSARSSPPTNHLTKNRIKLLLGSVLILARVVRVPRKGNFLYLYDVCLCYSLYHYYTNIINIKTLLLSLPSLPWYSHLRLSQIYCMIYMMLFTDGPIPMRS